MAKQQKQNIIKKLRLSQALVLNRYVLGLFGVTSFEAFANDEMKDARLEGWDENNVSNFHHFLVARLFHNKILDKDLLYQYDQNIYRYTQRISAKRSDPIRWKYFQYLSLLFTEIYLDKYFTNQIALWNDLNEYVSRFNSENEFGFSVQLYQMDDLNKLAFWNATGSGKTLIKHINILQYLFYLDKAGRTKELNRIILLTPNEGLSKQHLKEFLDSGFDAELFQKTGGRMFSGEKIEIIDIHKLEETQGEKTVAVDSFEGNNLVLVDEGHRGSSGEDWKDKRNRICQSGFSFEYSATFGQAVSAASGAKRDALLQEYAKCTLFDYSYRFFYKDGYGKDYNILNLNDTWNDSTTEMYLTACLLSFYQQLAVYEQNKVNIGKFLVEKPLWVFVGSKVTAVRTEAKKEVSDVVQILNFIAEFIRQPRRSTDYIERLLSGTDGLHDNNNRSIFHNSFAYLIKQRYNADKIYEEILKSIFNCSHAGALLHLDNLKGADGEIGMRIGDNEYFGVINVGDDSKLLKLCEQTGILTQDKDFSESLFHSINLHHSTINLLIGSKKFSEGWSSWRVSTMGLMNIGRGEGSEIIQLFGRGVRLKGYNFSLKRSDHLDEFMRPAEIPKYLKYIETLYVFGIRADYMQQFKEYLEEEGLNPDGPDFVEIDVPVIPTIDLKDKKLKILKVKDGVDFKRDVVFELPPPNGNLLSKVSLDWYPKVQIIQSAKGSAQGVENLESGKLSASNLAFIKWDEVYFAIQNFKNERSWHNLSIRKEVLQQTLKKDDWYELYIPHSELEVHSFSQTRIWQEIVIVLLKGYCERVYNFEKNKYLSKFLQVETLDPTHPNFIEKYRFYIEQSQEQIIEKVKALKELVERKEFKDTFSFGAKSEVFEISSHLYKPLVYFNATSYQDIVRLTPVQLNEGELAFIKHLKEYYEKDKSFFEGKELYLLRNLSKKGIGFFEANNFFPDFIMWLLADGKQYVCFIDPKGLRQINGFDNPKINFHKKIREEIQPRLGDDSIILNSFIISSTSFNEIKHWKGQKSIIDFNGNNVYFQVEQRDMYIRCIFQAINSILK